MPVEEKKRMITEAPTTTESNQFLKNMHMTSKMGAHEVVELKVSLGLGN